MKEVNDQVMKTLIETNKKLKEKKEKRRSELQFQLGDLVIVYFNKAMLYNGISINLQMKRIGPCKVLEKYVPNAYKVDLPKDMDISPIFNFKDLIPYKGPKMDEVEYQEELSKDVSDLQVPEKKQPRVERILDSRVENSIRKKVYKKHLIKWFDTS